MTIDRTKTFSLDGKIAIITGGAGALGKAIALGLGSFGSRIILVGRTESSLAEVSQELESQSIDSSYQVADVLNADDLKKVKSNILETHGGIDILINSAGGNQAGATVAEDASVFDLDIDAFRSVTDLNIIGTVLPTLIFGESMNDGGSVINMSSMASTRALSRVVGYSASKAAIDNFTRWMAVEMARKTEKNIRVNAISPGFFLGEQNRTLLLKPDESLTERGETIIRQTPMGRFGDPEDLITTAVWLCSDMSRFVTGTTISVDGGFSAFSGV